MVLLPELLHYQLGHLLGDVDTVALGQLQDVLEGKLPLRIGVTLVHPSHCLIRQRLTPLMGLLTAQDVN